MNLGKRIAAAVIATATALTALSVSSFAADVIGTNPTKLKDGEQVTAQIPFVDKDPEKRFDDGDNYVDFKFTAPADGMMKITYDISCSLTEISCYKADTLEQVTLGKSGSNAAKNGTIDSNGKAKWNANVSTFSGEKIYPVEKGDYYIRVLRCLYWNVDYHNNYHYTSATEGNGRLHITVEMVKPDAPGEIQVTDKTDTTARLQWREPEGCTSYDLRYKAGNGDWTTVKDIMDNNVTIKKLKGATKYTYQMRSHAGEIVGDWSKAASFKTTDPKNVKFDTPKINASIAVHITWKSVKNATGYKVQYSTDQKNWKTLTVEEPAADIPVVSGKTYYYKVAAKNSSKTGSFSKVSSIKIG